MKEKRAVTIYGASSPHVAHNYKDAAHALGQALAAAGMNLVSGGLNHKRRKVFLNDS